MPKKIATKSRRSSNTPRAQVKGKPRNGYRRAQSISARNRAAIRLLDQWMAEGSPDDDETWRAFKQTIEQNRLSYRKRFRD